MSQEMWPTLPPEELKKQMQSNLEAARRNKDLRDAFEYSPEPERTKQKTLATELIHALTVADDESLDSLLNPLGETTTSLVRSLVEKNKDNLATKYLQEIGEFNKVTNVKKRQQILEKIVKLAF
ncbi:MAG: hypothetical protein HY918_01410 [Candidatus Doudnabacteria bacterium]|nr:hypothetical protein [Candidatus Doudnabacteria bacterium]